MMYKYLFILLELLVFVLAQRRSARQPTSCRIQYNGSRGICTRYSSCSSAQYNLKQYRVQPTVCSHDRYGPIVCCPQKSVQLKSIPQTNIQSSRIRQNSQRNAAQLNSRPQTNTRKSRISVQKCREYYSSLQTKNDEFHTTLVGGENTNPGEFPFMTALGWRKNFGSGYSYLCGGFLVSPNYVVTAAHCTSLGGSAPSVVRTGGTNLDASQNSVVPIAAINIHPRYNPQYTYNDIALIRLSGRSSHTPACLWPAQSQNFVDVTALGYGHTSFAGRGSNILQKVQLKLYSNQQCSRYYARNSLLPKNIVSSQICAGDTTKSKDTCQGDSGGPILVLGKNQGKSVPLVLGITSFGQGCAGGTPSVYTRISSYLDWIESIVWR